MCDSAQEAFLEANTFYCEKLKARLTKEACEKNRRLPGWNDKVGAQLTTEAGSLRRPGPCEKCKGPTEAIIPKPKPQEKAMDEKPQFVCVRCKKPKPPKHNFGRGLCAACYMMLKKQGRLDELYPLKHSNQFDKKADLRKPPVSAKPTPKYSPDIPDNTAKLPILNLSGKFYLLAEIRLLTAEQLREIVG